MTMKDLSLLVHALTTHIATAIATHPEEVQVNVKEEESTVIVTLTANTSDLGRLIGKDGKTVNAIRALVKVPVTKSRRKLILSISG